MDRYDRHLMHEFECNNKFHVHLVSNKGFDPFFDVRNRLCDDFGLKLINEYGITDMAAHFEFYGRTLSLIYYGRMDMILLETDAEENSLIREFRRIAIALGAREDDE